MSIKTRLPDEAAVATRIDTVLASSLTDFLSATQMRRQEVISKRLYALLSLSLFIAVACALFIMQDHYGELMFNILIGALLFWVTATLLFGRQWFAGGQALAREMNMALVPILSSALDRSLLYTNDTAHREETLSLLTASELMTVSGATIVSDDMYTIYGDRELSARELYVTKREQRGKHSHVVELFKGVFVIVAAGRRFTGETYISTEGDKHGFAHRNFWNAAVGTNKVQETELEWNDFERDLHVAASDPVAAREILTPDFMQDLHAWWLEHEGNIRIAFKEDKIYVLLPDENIRIGMSTTSTKPEAIKRYALSVARPLWRTLMLVEDIR